ncbi:MAG: hypothetical protein ACP5TY_11545 [Thermodesulforhabdaceae bacterium]
MGTKLLVLDRNRNVRAFLQRELLREGYEVVLVRNLLELREQLKKDLTFDLLIVDVDVSDSNTVQILSWISGNRIPVVIHSNLPEHWVEEYIVKNMPGEAQTPIVIVEKENVEELKKVIKQMIPVASPEFGEFAD